MTFHPKLPSVPALLHKHWEVMTSQSQDLKRCFPRPSMVAYRRGRNLKDHLVKAKVSSKRKSTRIKNGYSACMGGCKLCWISKKASTHTCKRSKKTWNITSKINCQTSNVIYRLTCKKCAFWVYIGETKRKLCSRINEHRGSIKNKFGKIGEHFSKGHGKNPEAFLEVVGIEKINSRHPKYRDWIRKRREKLWINRYDSVRFGANTRS